MRDRDGHAASPPTDAPERTIGVAAAGTGASDDEAMGLAQGKGTMPVPPLLADAIGRLMSIEEVYGGGGELTCFGRVREPSEGGYETVADALRAQGVGLSFVSDPSGRAAATVTPLRAARSAWRTEPWPQLLLLLLTLATTTWAGALHQGVNLFAEPARWPLGIPYALALMGILGIHELGHYVVARRRGVHVTLPYFIPAPVYLGTFGAFIRMRGIVRNRSTYFDIAVAGPLAGLAAAIVALAVGLPGEITGAHGGMQPASSALFAGLYLLAVGGSPHDPVVLGPIAFAGWLGLVVTALNLIPLGQLDGGHIAYAVLGRRRAAVLGKVVLALMVAAGVLYSRHWLLWALIAWLVAGQGHLRAVDDDAPVGRGRMLLGWGTLALLLAIVLPWPA